jgi:peptide chain release factor 1
MLRAKLAQYAEEQAAAAASDARKAQIRTVDRSERIRTYNYPQNRITDHRIGYTAYNLDLALGGEMDGVFDALTAADRAARLTGETELTRQ